MSRTLTRNALPALLCLASALPAAAQGSRVAVMNFIAEKGVEAGAARILNELLLARINERGVFGAVIGEQDITAMLQLEEQRAMLTGCVDEMCLAEVGGALGVDYVFSSRIGKMGDSVVLSAKLLNTNHATVAGRSNKIVSPDERAMMDAVPDLVDAVLSQAFPQAGVIGAAAWSMAAVGAACLISGAVVGGLALVDQDELNSMEKYDPGRADLRDEVRTKGLVTDVLLGVGAAAAVTSLILFLVEGAGEEEGFATVTPLIGPERAGLALGLRY